MGNTHSKSKTNKTSNTEKHISTSTFSSSTTTTSAPPNSGSSTPKNKEAGGIEGDPQITHPTPHPRSTRKHALSELIDPQDLSIDTQIRTPDGTLLAPEQFFVRRDRPVCLRERQERIVRRVGIAVAEARAKVEREEIGAEEAGRRRGWGWCF